jgi:two-component system OmpR family response regulator
MFCIKLSQAAAQIGIATIFWMQRLQYRLVSASGDCMMTHPRHILIVDDHREIRDALVKYLEKNGMRATSAADAVAMDAAMKVGHFDLVVLDVMMPGEDGLSVCRRLRAKSDIPILMLTALGAETDRIVGLEVGADDYLPKPFNPRELLARIKAILRRFDRAEVAGGSLAGHKLAFDRWVLDTDRRTLIEADGAEVSLTTAEFRLLTVFLERPRFVLSREQLLDLTSGRASQVFDRTIDNQISRLRRKVEVDPAKPVLIATVWGGGYSLSADVKEIP